MHQHYEIKYLDIQSVQLQGTIDLKNSQISNCADDIDKANGTIESMNNQVVYAQDNDGDYYGMADAIEEMTQGRPILNDCRGY